MTYLCDLFWRIIIIIIYYIFTLMTELYKKKSLKLKLIEALGLKNILISNLVYRPPKISMI